VTVVEAGIDIHQGAPRCLLGHFDAEAGRWGIEVRGLSREDLRALIESSTRKIPTIEHRRLHQKASAFVWWGRRGGLRILALYGMPYFSLLARFRWGHVPLEALTRHRAGRLKGGGSLRPTSLKRRSSSSTSRPTSSI
jgi:hypothetical protein